MKPACSENIGIAGAKAWRQIAGINSMAKNGWRRNVGVKIVAKKTAANRENVDDNEEMA